MSGGVAALHAVCCFWSNLSLSLADDLSHDPRVLRQLLFILIVVGVLTSGGSRLRRIVFGELVQLRLLADEKLLIRT